MRWFWVRYFSWLDAIAAHVRGFARQYPKPTFDNVTVTVVPLTLTLIVFGFGGVAVVAVVGGATLVAGALELLLDEPQAETPRAAAPPPARAATAINCARMVTG